MPRPSAYSRGRRTVMQITMFGVLLLTLGIAALVARSREQATAVELTAKPHLTERLGIRLPKGWIVDQDSTELPIEVIATDRATVTDREPRAISVFQTDAPPADAKMLLTKYLNETVSVTDTFSVLGEPGVIAGLEHEHVVEHNGRKIVDSIPGWYAAVILPGKSPKGGNLGIVIGVQGRPVAGPAGKRLVRQVADGLTVRGTR